MAGTWIDIGEGFRGYLAVPQCGSGPGLLLLQEIFGVNPHMRDVADYYAEEGYVVLAPDLFWRLEPGVELGHSEADLARAFALYGQFDTGLATQDISTAAACLRARAECTGKVGALGFCLGGLLAYLAAARCGVDCAVGYYGVGIEKHLDEAASIGCPLVLHFGELDKFVSGCGARCHRRRPGRSRRRADLRVSRLRSCIQQPRAAELRQDGGADGALALDRGTAPGDGAALRSVGVMGAAYGVMNSANGMRRRRCARWCRSLTSTTSR